MFFFRYKGKSRPDAVMAEICWRAQQLFQDVEFRCPTNTSDVEEFNDEEAEMFADYRDSDNDDDEDYDYDDYF